MKLEKLPNSFGGTSVGFSTDDGESFVGHPREIRIDYQTRNIDPDIILVAGALLFGSDLSMWTTTPAKVSSSVYQSIIDFLGPGSGFPAAIQTSGPASPAGQNTFVVDPDPVAYHSNVNQIGDTGRRIELALLDTSEFVGRLFSMNKIAIASNVQQFVDIRRVARPVAHLGVALLLAGDWRVGHVSVSGLAQEVESERLSRIVRMCSSIGISVDSE